ncbi:hypothetical protein KXD93_01100 [Mucilaginibacter sp. BJC16-A38]|uniref:hypothetical protein n=1 Tax=Mucilaginibacter phenanthrenivorans TaxID=1234842 RepID=UPI0021583051|nr:hypothetical protein [Mucilaginibacter phenanthrenivorans]MCR8556216.1 hypothetical protein [Mucilaginibacter phenanthrenivorans]
MLKFDFNIYDPYFWEVERVVDVVNVKNELSSADIKTTTYHNLYNNCNHYNSYNFYNPYN